MGLRTFINNIRYLFRYNIKPIGKDGKWYRQRIERCVFPLLSYVDHLYRSEPTGIVEKPKILSTQETLHELLTTNKSLVRFGEGELMPIKGGEAIFQKHDAEMAKRLEEILKSDDENILLCVQSFLWYRPKTRIESMNWDDWWFINRPYLRLIAEEQMRQGKVYGETGSTYECYNISEQAWCTQWRALWEGKDIVLICGDRVFDRLETNVFDNAKSIEHLYVPTRDAFAEYDSILRRASQTDKSKLICISAGPTATVLAYDLAKLGYRALDIGHLPKAYDVFTRRLPEDHELRTTFWLPD